MRAILCCLVNRRTLAGLSLLITCACAAGCQQDEGPDQSVAGTGGTAPAPLGDAVGAAGSDGGAAGSGGGAGGAVGPSDAGVAGQDGGGAGPGGGGGNDAAGATGGAMGTDGGAGGVVGATDAAAGGASGSMGVDFCRRENWTATASSSFTGPSPGPPANAIDGNLTDRWTSGRDPDGTDWFQVNFGGTVTLTSITLDNTQDVASAALDYPHTYAVYGSTNGVTFGNAPFVSGNGTVKSTLIPFGGQTSPQARSRATSAAGAVFPLLLTRSRATASP